MPPKKQSAVEKQLYVLQEDDLYVFGKADERWRYWLPNVDWAAEGPPDGRFFTSYYFRHIDETGEPKENDPGWIFDNGFDPPWQLLFHHAPQKDVVVVAGMGSGKTSVVGMSAITKATLNRDYIFYNVAGVSKQSGAMYKWLKDHAKQTLFMDRFWYHDVSSPNPTIYIKFKYPDGTVHESELHFEPANNDGENLLTLEADYFNVEQAEAIKDLEKLMIAVGTRVRGVRPDGTAREGRVTLIANSNLNPYFWYLFNQSKSYPSTNLSITATTYGNKNNTDDQIKAFERRMGNDPTKIAQHLKAEPPLGSGKEFPSSMIARAVDDSLDRIMENAIANRRPGFEVQEAERAGVVLWEMPPDPHRTYVVVGDPGQGIPPYRNAPVIMVIDTTDLPKGKAVLRALWWGDGGGLYEPWMMRFFHYLSYYRADLGAYDSTGGQKVHDEITFHEKNNVVAIDMGGLKKAVYITVLKLVFQKGLLAIPKKINGLLYQLAEYELPDKDIPQDLVATLFVYAGLLKWMGVDTLINDDAPIHVEYKPTTPLTPRRDRYSRGHVRNRFSGQHSKR